MYTITIYGRTITTAEGRSFTVYSTKDLDDNYYDVKFTKSCMTRPVEPCLYEIIVAEGNAWTKVNPKGEKLNDLLFIKKVESIKKIERSNESKLRF